VSALFIKGTNLKAKCNGCGAELVFASGAVALAANPDDPKWIGAAAKRGWRLYKNGAECGECVATPMRRGKRHEIIFGK